MKIKLIANELVDGKIEYVSLVKNGANRSSWKIIKTDASAAGISDTLEFLQAVVEKADALLGSTNSEKVMKMKDIEKVLASGVPSKVKKTEPDTNAEVIEQVCHRKEALEERLHQIWERPDSPISKRLEQDCLYAIEKCDMRLSELGRTEENIVDKNSAFFFRGGTSSYLDEPVYDSAFSNERYTSVRKAEGLIDLGGTICLQTDEDEVNAIDLDKDFV